MFTLQNFLVHEMSVKPKTVRITNFFGNGSLGSVTIGTNTTFTSSVDGNPVVRQYENLTINNGATVTVDNRCRGLVIYVNGNCTINGTVTMSAKGAIAGANTTTYPEIFLRKNTSGSYIVDPGSMTLPTDNTLLTMENGVQPSYTGNVVTYNVPRSGASGGSGFTPSAGSNGVNGQCGGGGGGGAGRYNANAGGNGASGSCYGGGGGGGGSSGGSGTSVPGGNAVTYSGAGGNGGGVGSGRGGGGAGNPGGAGYNTGSLGVGGVIYLIVGGNLTIGSTGVISANGTRGGNADAGDGSRGGSGGGSGGGSITMIYGGTYSNAGSAVASGGSGGTGGYYSNGAAGGAGSIRVAHAITGSI